MIILHILSTKTVFTEFGIGESVNMVLTGFGIRTACLWTSFMINARVAACKGQTNGRAEICTPNSPMLTQVRQECLL